MVELDKHPESAHILKLLSAVVDPEIPVLTLEDLGVLRAISVVDDTVGISITPTYAGCPAIDTMRTDIETTLAAAGYREVRIQQSLSPAWTTDWMTETGRKKLRAYGIAPPPAMTSCGRPKDAIECPQCCCREVKLISEFGSTACKALYRCQDCREPFDYFKCI